MRPPERQHDSSADFSTAGRDEEPRGVIAIEEAVEEIDDAVAAEIAGVARRRRYAEDNGEVVALIRRTHLECLAVCEIAQREKTALSIIRQFHKEFGYGGQKALTEFLSRSKSTISLILNDRRPMNEALARDILLAFQWQPSHDDRVDLYADALARCLTQVQKAKFARPAPTRRLNVRRVKILKTLVSDDWEYALYRAEDPVILWRLACRVYQQLQRQEWAVNEVRSSIDLIKLGYDWFDLVTDSSHILSVLEAVRQ